MVDYTTDVRLAVQSDEEDIMALCRLLHEENGLWIMNETKVRQMLRKAWRKEFAVIGIVGKPGALEGVIFLTLDQPWYSDEWMLEEMFNFVHPAHRKSGHAKRLVEFAKQTSEGLGVPLMIGIISNERTDAKVRLYQRQLGAPAGAFFVFGRKTGNIPAEH